MFEIRTDPKRALIAEHVRGFWGEDTTQTFVRRHLEAVRSLNLPAGKHHVLADFSDLAIQSQKTIGEIQRLIEGNTAKRIALVTSRALSRMQVKRLQVRDNVAVFADAASAETWLFDCAEAPSVGAG